jgi:capsular exopolysaccharide synthesis family protein
LQLQKKENTLLAGVLEIINSTRKNIDITRQFIRSEKLKSIAEQNKLPEIEQQLLNIERDFNTTNELYTILLQKNVEAQIQKASNVADNEIVEYASFNQQIAPNTQKILILGFSFGLLIPVFLIVVKDFFNVKVQSLEDVQKITNVPVLGSVGIGTEKAKIITAEEPTSITAEAFRSIRTKLDFITKGEGNKTILISSTMPGEGKTFCAINLAGIFSIQDKKTIILGMDLRKPRLHEMFGLENKKGITNYLIGSISLDDAIQPLGYANLDCMLSGPIPPNPAELINSKKTKELFDELKKRYDHIIIDTSPIGPVTDALLLNKYVDAFLYVVRHRHTVKQFFAHNISLATEVNPANLSIIFNGVKFKNVGYSYGYGYHYGYGYGDKRDRRRFNILRRS